MVRVGLLSVAHMHAFGYASALRASADGRLAGVWDDNAERGKAFAERFETPFHPEITSLLAEVDAVVITSENTRHAGLAERAAAAGKHILCEKPVVTNEEHGRRMMDAVAKAGVRLMTAFPCRYSPAYKRLKERVRNGDIGRILAVCATNHGMCPFDWFVERDKSGGGAMMDHTVHVADLLRDLLQDEPETIYAQTSNNIYGKDWEDTAMLQVRFKGGVFATIDASWSRPGYYKTWGDVKMNVVGEKGVIEMDMFSQAFDVYRDPKHSWSGFGSDLDAELVGDFLQCISTGKEPPISGEDGLRAARFALAGYESARSGEPVAV